MRRTVEIFSRRLNKQWKISLLVSQVSPCRRFYILRPLTSTSQHEALYDTGRGFGGCPIPECGIFCPFFSKNKVGCNGSPYATAHLFRACRFVRC